uniref:Riboflavin transporter n=1 Tax=Anolis carolinensis TaxID=28377 RepID=H9GNM4_ANOCA
MGLPPAMALVVHLLSCLLGTGSWVAINGVWVELPLVVAAAPEGWLLPSYLTVIIQLANLGPLVFTLAHRFGRLGEVGVIYGVLALGCLSCLLLAFFWGSTSVVAGVPRSTALLALLFFLALVDCTSSVTFLPYMRRFQPVYLTTYFIGEGLSGLLPGLVALGQGVGTPQCHGNGSNTTGNYQAPHFSVQTFFLFLTAMMGLSLASFILLNHLPVAKKEREKETGYTKEDNALRAKVKAEKPSMVQGSAGRCFGSGVYSRPQLAYIFVLLAWVNALTNGVLPAVQSYSCLPYGHTAYHLSATLAALANPMACFLGRFLPSRSLVLLGGLSLAGSLVASYIMAMAILSPCPPLMRSSLGVILIVSSRQFES